MLKFFRKIRKGLLLENKFIKYLLYAIGEIVLVVIGILIALQINNWNKQEIEKEDEKKSYLNIKRQVQDDRNELVTVSGINNFYSGAYIYASKIISTKDHTKIDSLALITMALSQYSDFNSSGTIYETLVNSGDLKLLKNSEITGAIQQLEATYIFANKLEDIHWEIIINELSPELKGVINYTSFQTVRPEKLYGVELQNIFFEIINLTQYKDSIYNRALSQIDTITSLIDEELDSKGEK